MPADTAPAWPDPERPGVPLNPERDGWHWLLFRDGSRVCSWWNASACGWASSDTPGYGADYLPEEAEQDHVTCEPCLTPSEVTAREAAAWAAGAEAMQRDIERACNSHGNTLAQNGLLMSAISVARTCAVIAGTLPTPPMPGQPQGGSDAG